MTDVILRGTFLQNARGLTVADGGGATWSFDPATNTLSAAIASGGIPGFNESVDDRVAALLQSVGGITWSYNDVGNALSPAVSLAGFSTTDLGEGTQLYFTDERAQDAVAGMIADSATIAFSYNDVGNSFTADVKTNSIGDSHLRQSGGLSVVGRSANTTGDVADIVAGANDRVLRRVSDTVSFGELTVGMAANDLWTYAKLQNVSATNRVLGRVTSGAGDIEELTAANVVSILAGETYTFNNATVAWSGTNGTVITQLLYGGGGTNLQFGTTTNHSIIFFQNNSTRITLANGLITVATSTRFNGTIGFNNTAPIAKPTITGSRGGNAALASLLTELANYGLITDSTTA
jgi:hypothetical protein